jgi:hypothetical protein
MNIFHPAVGSTVGIGVGNGESCKLTAVDEVDVEFRIL